MTPVTLTLPSPKTRIQQLELENATFKAQLSELFSLNHRQSVEISGLKTQLAQKDARIEELELLLKRTSKTSSKPPSSDFTTKPNVPASTKPRGAKPGHRGTTRKDWGTPDRVVDLTPASCDGCGSSLEGLELHPGHRHQVAEWKDRPIEVVEYHHQVAHCPGCHKRVEAPYPTEIIPGSRLGPRLIAHLALLHQWGNLSYEKLERLLSEDFGVPVTTSTLVSHFQKLREALKPSYRQLAASIRLAGRLNVDETGWRVDGVRHWVWCFGTDALTYLTITRTRGGIVLNEVLGSDWHGTLTCDFYSAYDRYLTQRCLAHLRRDLKACLDVRSLESQAFAAEALSRIAEAWDLWRRYHDGAMSHPTLQERGEEMQKEFRQFLASLPDLPKPASTLKQRFIDYWDEIWRFLTDPALAPENNAAERTLRPIVTHRKVSGGSRSPWGAEFTAMMHSVTDTCRKQGRSAHDFLVQAILARVHPDRVRPPSLLNK